MKGKTLPVSITMLVLFAMMNGYAQTPGMFHPLKAADMVTKTQTAKNVYQLEGITVHSTGLGNNILGDPADRKVAVYLPPSYNVNMQKHYPVIYLLGGYGMKYNDWFGAIDARYDLNVTLDNLINQGKINDVIVVSPDNYNKYMGSWFTNSTLAGNWEDFNAVDLVKYIDSHYRTISKPESRGIAGYSMGGYGAIILAMKYSDIFSCVYSISGALLDFQERIMNDAGTKNELINAAKLTNSTFTSQTVYLSYFSMAIAFAPGKNAVGYGELPLNAKGELIDSVWQKWLVHDPASMVPVYKQNLAKLHALVMECGTGEPEIYKENLTFSKILKDNGREHTLNIHSGDHSYSVNYRMGSHVFPFFSENLVNYYISTNEICHTLNDTLEINMLNADGTLFITPLSTKPVMNEIQANQLYSIKTKALETVKIASSKIGKGEYLAWGVTDDGFITVPVWFSISLNTPKMTVRVCDEYSGNPVPGCQLKIDGKNVSTNQVGEIIQEGCGNHFLQVIDPNVFNYTANFMVYNDTFFLMKVSKKSFVKVVDRKTGNPLNMAIITYKHGQAGTDNHGLANIQVLRDDTVLTFIISRSDYFTFEDSSATQYGDTITYSLTKKIASFEILVKDGSGPVVDQKVQLGSGSLITNSSGKVKFYNKPARQNYQYIIIKPCCLPVSESFYLEIDTLIEVTLLPDTLPAVLFCEKINNILKVTSSKPGYLYAVPSGIKMEIDSIVRYQLLKRSVTANELLEIYTTDISNTDYWLYLVDFCDNITKLTPPVVNIQKIADVYFRIFPNPARDVITIQMQGGGNYAVEMAKANGTVIYKSKVSGTSYEINLSALSNGVYFVTVTSNGFVSTRKIIKL